MLPVMKIWTAIFYEENRVDPDQAAPIGT